MNRWKLSDHQHLEGKKCRTIGVLSRSLAALLEQFGYQAGPAGLVVGAQAGAGVAVEVFIGQAKGVRQKGKSL